MTSRQKREANLGIVLISISVLFIFCQSIKVIPDIYEVITCRFRSSNVSLTKCPTTDLMEKLIDISHLLLAINSSANFVLYTWRGKLFWSTRPTQSHYREWPQFPHIPSVLSSPLFKISQNNFQVEKWSLRTGLCGSSRVDHWWHLSWISERKLFIFHQYIVAELLLGFDCSRYFFYVFFMDLSQASVVLLLITTYFSTLNPEETLKTFWTPKKSKNLDQSSRTNFSAFQLTE